jgi:hypothetical protein
MIGAKMSTKLEDRVAALERQVAQLQAQQKNGRRAWLDDLYGKFANDPVFDTAMRMGREYRKSLRPVARKGKPRK